MRKKWYWLRLDTQKKDIKHILRSIWSTKGYGEYVALRNYMKLRTLLFMYSIFMWLNIQVLTLLDVLDPSPEPSLEVALQACHTRLQGGTSCVAGTRGSGGGGAPDVEASRRRWIHLQFFWSFWKTDRPYKPAFHLSPPILGGNLPDSGFFRTIRSTVSRHGATWNPPKAKAVSRSSTQTCVQIKGDGYEIYEVLPERTKRNVAT